MTMLTGLVAILLAAMTTNNFILSKFLGICPFLGVSKKTGTAVGMSVAVIFVMALATAATYPLNKFLANNDLAYLQTIVQILVIAALVQFVEIVLKKFIPALYNALGIYLPLITTNCAVLGVVQLNVQNEYGFAASLVNAIGGGLGFMIAMIMFSGVREKLEGNDYPKFWEGLPITLVAAALTACSFLGFTGLVDLSTIDASLKIDTVETTTSGSIVLAIVVVSVIGLILGLVLAVASIVMAVPVDEKAEAIQEVLAGANCGACGYSGCAGYAGALSKGDCTDCTLCAPGGKDCAAAIAEIMGLAAGEMKPMTAVVMCHGTPEKAPNAMAYHGDMSCKTAAQLFGGPKGCNYGCLGLGDCVKACPYNALSIVDGIAKVDPLACKACKMCIKTCPKGIIDLVPLYEQKALNFCMNKDKGNMTSKQCTVGCIGCMKCVKACEFDAIHVENNNATVDYSKCTGCGKCVEGCPKHCLELVTLGCTND